MALVRLRNRSELDPWSALNDVESSFSQFMAPFFSNRTFGRPGWVPAVDLGETKDAYHLTADVPGLKKEDIQIEVIDNVVTIKGERKTESENKEKDYHHIERSYGSFQRSVEVPGGFVPDRVTATFENGVLTVTLPKREEAKPKSITVQAS